MPGRFIAPTDPYQDFSMGCLRVFYPDSPLLFQALMGQLAYLENRFVWNTGGDIPAAEKLAQDWHHAGDLTRASSADGCPDDCPDVGDLETEIIRLTEVITEYENMNITVNCNCNTNVTCSPWGNPVDPTGTPYPLFPLDPLDPFGEIVPTWDDAAEIPPPGYETTQEWSEDRCRAANWFVDSYIAMVERLDIIERQGSIVASVIDVAAVLIAMLPGPIGDWAGAVVILKWTKKVADLLAEAVDELEDLADWLQVGTDLIGENRDELVCAAYQMADTAYLKEFILTFLAGPPNSYWTDRGVPVNTVPLVRDLLSSTAELIADRLANGFANQNIPDDYMPETDCSNCPDGSGIPAPVGFEYVPAVPVSALAYGGSGTSLLSADVDGESVTLSFSGSSSARTGRADVTFQGRPSLEPGESWVGFRHTPNRVVNSQSLGMGVTTLGTDDFSTYPDNTLPDGVPVNLVLTSAGFPIVDGQERRTWNGLDFGEGKTDVGLTCQNIVTGLCEAAYSGFYWIKKLS